MLVGVRWCPSLLLVGVFAGGCPVPTPIGTVAVDDSMSATGSESNSSGVVTSGGSTSGTTLPGDTGPLDVGPGPGDGPGSGEVTSAGTDTATTGGDFGPLVSIAFFPSEIADTDTDTDTSPTAGDTTAGPGNPGEPLVIAFATDGRSCASPEDPELCNSWNITLELQLEQQMPGVYDLLDVNANFTVLEQPPMGGTCLTSGGNLEGRLFLDSIDSSFIEGQLDVIDPAPPIPFELLLFTAERC